MLCHIAFLQRSLNFFLPSVPLSSAAAAAAEEMMSGSRDKPYTHHCFSMSAIGDPPPPAHLVAQLQAVEGVGGVRVEGLRQVAQGEGEVPRQVRVPVQAVLQSLGQDGIEHQWGQQLTGGLAAAQLLEGRMGESGLERGGEKFCLLF